ncbi:MAG: hypothetical protein II899_02025 [Bacteroidales bacterium]|nr:hypothetical protein [Bacteroidales bacterium]
MTDKDSEIARLREKLQQSRKENKSLKGKLNTAKAKAAKAWEEVKSLKKKRCVPPPIPEEIVEEFLNMLDDTTSVNP